jgi:hypothetical protein
MESYGKPGVAGLKAAGVRIKSLSRVDAREALVIHLAGAYGMPPADIAELMDVPRSTLRGYLTKWNGWTFTSEEVLLVLWGKDSHLNAAYRDVSSLREVNRQQQELIAINEEARRSAQVARDRAERECGEILALTSTFSAETQKEIGDLRDEVASLNDELLKGNARFREQMSERDAAIKMNKAERRSESLRRERQMQDLTDVCRRDGA